MPIEDIASIATGRTTALFSTDIAARTREISEWAKNKRFLFIGGAGSIGSATLRLLLEFAPAAVHVVDHNENNLAELVRHLRSGQRGLGVSDFRCLPLDFGSPVMHRFLNAQPPYDAILNFAAVKHVRSEKDVFSILHMLETNVLRTARLMGWLDGKLAPSKFFCVSTDKAANPVNFMGASKRLMEEIIFSQRWEVGLHPGVTSARFANVAFSDGSLLQSFQRRLESRQPIAVPKGTRRYFISLRESAQICLLSLMCAPPGHLLVPRFTAESDLLELEAIALRFVRHHRLEPKIYEEEDAARASLEGDLRAGRYPLLLTPLDTSGEKAFEEFAGEGESAIEVGLPNLLAIRACPGPARDLDSFLENLAAAIDDCETPVSIEELAEEIRAVLPGFRHFASARCLDDRM